MCGIAGIFSTGQRFRPDEEKLRRMSDVMAHRGPDGEGHWISDDGVLGFAHRRLSIIDLSDSASQPMLSADGRYVIIFNGEIYNYIELKKDLEKEGCVFHTHSDTEVLLNLFIKKGPACLKDLDGMFAFAVWDQHTRALFCARDRFGEKPFFYVSDKDYFVFASEIKAIRAYGIPVKLSTEKLEAYLHGTFGFGNEDTPFAEVHAMPPAHYLTVTKDGMNLQKYWEIQPGESISFHNDADAFEAFRDLFFRSLRRRLRSDVPVGSSLSGGLDSSTVVCALSGQEKVGFHAFSARFNSEKDEGKWMEEVVRKTGVLHHEVWPGEQGLLDEVDKITWFHEFPLGSASVYAQWCVMQMPRQQGVKVLLDGQGADEYLCGYDELKYYAIWDLCHQGHWRDFLHERRLFKKFYGHHGRLGWAFLADPLLALFGIQRAVYRNGYTIKQQLGYYTQHKLGELLRFADRNSMAHSIEVRLPFLSHELVEFVFQLAGNYVYRDGKTKFILRESMKDILPDAIYNRTDKIGFAPPQRKWEDAPHFTSGHEASLRILQDAGMQAGMDKFRNFAVASLVKVFGS